jgi:hypothetical protein
LEQFVVNNQNLGIDYAVDDDQCIKHCFLFHGSMKKKLQHTQPVISIDATFIKEGIHLSVPYIW